MTMKNLISLLLPLLLSSCWIQTTETRGKVDTKNLVSLEEVRNNPDKYLGKKISFRFKMMQRANATYGLDTNCCALTFTPESALGISPTRSSEDYLFLLNRIQNKDFVNKMDKPNTGLYKHEETRIDDLKGTNVRTVLNDVGCWTGYFNCPLPAELYNKGYDSLTNLHIATKDEIWGGEYFPALSNTYTGGIATGIVFTANTQRIIDSTNVPQIEKIIGKELYGTTVEVYMTGLRFKKNLF